MKTNSKFKINLNNFENLVTNKYYKNSETYTSPNNNKCQINSILPKFEFIEISDREKTERDHLLIQKTKKIDEELEKYETKLKRKEILKELNLDNKKIILNKNKNKKHTEANFKFKKSNLENVKKHNNHNTMGVGVKEALKTYNLKIKESMKYYLKSKIRNKCNLSQEFDYEQDIKKSTINQQIGMYIPTHFLLVRKGKNKNFQPNYIKTKFKKKIIIKEDILWNTVQ